MFELAREIIGTQPILAIFLAIGLGYLVGQINLGGFSLGVGAVLFVGLAIGAFAPKSQIVGPIGLTGLIMFLYGIGILYGRQFFEGMIGAAGIKNNLLALVAVVAGLLVALGLGQIFGIKIGHTLGIFAGSMTSTATLQAALDVMRNKEPSIGYSIAYPFGVIGPILCIYFMTRQVQPKFPPKAQRFHMGEITLGENFAGRTLEELRQGPACRRADDDGAQGQPEHCSIDRPRAGRRRRPDDHCRATGGHCRDRDAIGQLEPGRLVKDRSALDYIRVFVGKANMVGMPLAQLPLPAGFPVHLLHVRRYDMDLVPTPDLTLEFGDRVGVLMPPDRREEVRRHFGDTHEGDGGIQLRVARARHGAGRPARADPDSDSWRRDGHSRHRRRTADRRAHRSASCAGPALCSGSCRCRRTSCCETLAWRSSSPPSASTPDNRSCAPCRRPD